MGFSRVYIGLGSNQGDRLSTLLQAIRELENFVKDLKFSSVWETAALIVEDQPPFLNMVVEGQYEGTAEDLIKKLWELENRAGRDRSKEIQKGPRPLDLDILLYGRECINTEILTIPHPGIRERAFVLVPLKELDKSLRDPLTGELYAPCLDAIENQSFICYKNESEFAKLL